MATTGIDALYGLPLTDDVKGAVVYDFANIKKICDSINVNVKKEYAKAEQHASNILKRSARRLIKVTIEIDTDDLELDVEAWLKGYTVATGGYTETDESKEKYFAFMLKGDINIEDNVYISLYKGTVEIEGEIFKTKKDNIEFQNGKLKIVCTANADGKIMDKRRSDATDFEVAVKDDWNKQPYGYNAPVA